MLMAHKNLWIEILFPKINFTEALPPLYPYPHCPIASLSIPISSILGLSNPSLSNVHFLQ